MYCAATRSNIYQPHLTHTPIIIFGRWDYVNKKLCNDARLTIIIYYFNTSYSYTYRPIYCAFFIIWRTNFDCVFPERTAATLWYQASRHVTVVERAFSLAGSLAWNSLPLNVPLPPSLYYQLSIAASWNNVHHAVLIYCVYLARRIYLLTVSIIISLCQADTCEYSASFDTVQSSAVRLNVNAYNFDESRRVWSVSRSPVDHPASEKKHSKQWLH